MEELKLTLSPEKTKITDSKTELVCFLGFSLCYYAQSLKITTVSSSSEKTHTKRSTGNQLVIGIEQKRLDSRLILNKYLSEKKGPRGEYIAHRKAAWTVLTDYEIILRFN
jgi:hypothetical protein